MRIITSTTDDLYIYWKTMLRNYMYIYIYITYVYIYVYI